MRAANESGDPAGRRPPGIYNIKHKRKGFRTSSGSEPLYCMWNTLRKTERSEFRGERNLFLILLLSLLYRCLLRQLCGPL